MKVNPGAILKGLGVGLVSAVGEVLVIQRPADLPEWTYSNKSSQEELAILEDAIEFVSNQLAELGNKAAGTNAEIFSALRTILEDDELTKVAAAYIEEGWSAGAAITKAFDEFSELLTGDQAFEERISDLQDLSKRVQARLAGIELKLSLPTQGNLVLVAEDFSPADTAQFTEAVVGVITLKGGPTSHTAIICKSKSIAAVVSCPEAASLTTGDRVLVDPVGNRVVIGGDQSLATKTLTFEAINDQPLIPVRVNIANLEEARAARQTTAHGVGLFRTELLYLSTNTEPSVRVQAESYLQILEAAPSGPIVVRTIDVSPDKPVPFLKMPREQTQSLGFQGYQLMTENPGFLRSQLEALEQARFTSQREVWVMAPMISNLEQAWAFAELARSMGSYRVGIMVETPAIADLVAQLEGVLDFISVGTNDLSQYLFGSNRLNPTAGSLFDHWQPTLIKKLATIARDAASAGIQSAVCGESASDPVFAVVLAGLGIDSVSVSKSQVATVQNALSSLSMAEAKQIAESVLAATTAEQAKATALAEITRR